MHTECSTTDRFDEKVNLDSCGIQMKQQTSNEQKQKLRERTNRPKGPGEGGVPVCARDNNAFFGDLRVTKRCRARGERDDNRAAAVAEVVDGSLSWWYERRKRSISIRLSFSLVEPLAWMYHCVIATVVLLLKRYSGRSALPRADPDSERQIMLG